MAARLNPYLNFDGQSAEAMTFYQQVLGGELNISRFGDFGETPPGVDPDGTMHAMLETPDGFTLMASDMPPGQAIERGNNLSVSLSGDDEESLRGYFTGLSEDGTVTMPLEPQMWGDIFGMVIDKFGTAWMVNIAGPSAQG
ncbi:MAG: VOC family protein [Phycicoccus sp.]|nr:VOC family protein [Phycicoccus sp.]